MEWQLIDTLDPKEYEYTGKEFLVATKDSVTQAFLDNGEIYDSCQRDYCQWEGHSWSTVYEPTHWMPLPASPVDNN